MNRSTKIVDKGWNRILREVRTASTLEVATGLLSGAKTKKGASIAEYGTFNEFGTAKVPSRPFMRTAFDENKQNIAKNMDFMYMSVLQGRYTIRQALARIGMAHASDIKNTITDRNFLPRLSPETIRRKKGSTKTLVDTGAMVNAVHISIRKKGTQE